MSNISHLSMSDFDVNLLQLKKIYSASKKQNSTQSTSGISFLFLSKDFNVNQLELQLKNTLHLREHSSTL